MKVLITIVLAIGSVSALGSGPYLPSGWRPDGPSFYLPSEVSKPSAAPEKVNLFQETEASGSDALREYGPPKLEEVVQAVQGLPDVATEQTFFIDVRGNKEQAVQEAITVEANTEQISAKVEEVSTATEAQQAEISVEEPTTAVLSEAVPTFEVIAEIVEQASEAVQAEQATEEVSQEEVATPTAAAVEEETIIPTVAAEIVVPTDVIKEAVVPTEIIQEEVIVPTAALEQVVVERVAEGVNNIADALINLEKEVKAAEALDAAVEIKQEISGSLEQAPEGFLEYGPPGFREYGPPKQDDLARSSVIEVASASGFENNEVRRRRFSPKFKKSHRKH